MKNDYNLQKASLYIFSGMQEYSRYVCTSRAIPALTDGFKSSQRIALWEATNSYGSNAKIKTLGLVGSMMASGLYVHGDASASSAIQSMAAPYINNNSIFVGHGSFGNMPEPREFGAPRYTSVSVSDFTKSAILCDRELLKLVPSIDGDNKICETFLPLVPNVLLNGISGIALGYSTNILSHKLSDLKKAVVAKLNGKTVKNIKPHFENYDLEIDDLGDLVYNISGKITIENTSTVIINSIPPTIGLERLKIQLDKLIESNHIVSYEDEVSNDFRIVVKFRRADLADQTEESLKRLFKLNVRMTERLVVVMPDKRIKTYDNHDDLLTDWVNWRFPFFKKRYERFAEKHTDRIEFLEAVRSCFLAELPKELDSLKNRKQLEERIEKICGKSFPKIAEYPSYRWTKEHYENVVNELEVLEKERTEFLEIVNSVDKQKEKFIEDLKNVK